MKTISVKISSGKVRLHGPPKGGGIQRWKRAIVVPDRITNSFLARMITQSEAGQIGGLHFERIGFLGFGGGAFWIGKLPKKERSMCGAKTRKGTPCRARCVEGRERCRMHGGLSTGAKTAEGRARIVESNRRRAQVRRAALAKCGFLCALGFLYVLFA